MFLKSAMFSVAKIKNFKENQILDQNIVFDRKLYKFDQIVDTNVILIT